MNEKVRVHLNTAILVGHGREARYAKVLVGERAVTAGVGEQPGEGFEQFTILGYIRNYASFNLPEPMRVWLTRRNILAIEDCGAELCCTAHKDGCDGYVHHHSHGVCPTGECNAP